MEVQIVAKGACWGRASEGLNVPICKFTLDIYWLKPYLISAAGAVLLPWSVDGEERFHPMNSPTLLRLLLLGLLALAFLEQPRADVIPVTVRHPDLPAITAPNGDSRSPVWAAGHRYVFFVSDASNLVTNDWNGAGLDLFRRDRVTGETLLVSVAQDSGVGANGSVLEYSVSSDGNRVVWMSDASNLVPGDTNQATDVFLRDLNAGTTTLVSWNLDRTGPGRGASFSPVLSADGRRVIYGTPAENVEAGAPPSSGHRLCLRDVETRVVTLICDEPWRFKASANANLVVYATERPPESSPGRTPTALMVWRADSEHAERLSLPIAFISPVTQALDVSHLCLTPSGNHLGFYVPAEGQNSIYPPRGLWLADLQKGPVIQIWDPGRRVFPVHPHWMSITEDGARMAFVLLREQDTHGEVRVWTDDGTGIQTLEELVTSGAAPALPLRTVEGVHLSPEGSRLLFFTRESVPEAGVNSAGDSRAYLRTLTTGATRDIASGEVDIEAAFDPTGEFLAYSASESRMGGSDWQEQSSVFVLDRSDAAPARISEAAVIGPSPVASATVARVAGLSDDGQQILFQARAPDLFPGARSKAPNLFSFDVQSGTNRWLDDPGAGRPYEPNARAHLAAIAADGRWAAFGTTATNLPERSKLYHNLVLRNIASGETVLATPEFPSVEPFLSVSFDIPPQISGDGQRVHMRWNSTRPPPKPVLFDQRRGYVSDVSTFGRGSPVSNPSTKTVLSADGQRIAYTSSGNMAGWLDLRRRADVSAPNPNLGYYPAPLWVDGQSDQMLVVKSGGSSPENPSIRRLRVPSGEQEVLVAGTDFLISVPRASAGGSLVVFSGRPLNAVAGPVPMQIFAKAVDGGPAERISIGLDGGLANGDCRPPRVSADGRFVVFTSMASNLVAGDTNGFADVFVRDRYAGVTHLLSRLADGSQEDGHCAGAAISGDGRTVAFTTFGRRLVPGDASREPTLVYTLVPQSSAVDSDGDGLPDTWEQDHFAGLAEGPDGDFDDDGHSNRDEFLARTSPAEAASRLEMVSMEAIAGGFEVSWHGHAGVSYQLEQRTSLAPGSSWAAVGSPQPGYEGLIHQLVPGSDLGAFYRVAIVAP